MSDALSNPLWKFAADRYARPGAPELCLRLQDRAGLDVSFVLACLWLGSRGVPASEAGPALQSAYADTCGLAREVLGPLRAGRRQLKQQLETFEASLREPARALRGRLAELELGLEQLQLARIHAALAPLPGGSRPDPRGCLDCYLRAAQRTLDAEAEADFERLTRSAA